MKGWAPPPHLLTPPHRNVPPQVTSVVIKKTWGRKNWWRGCAGTLTPFFQLALTLSPHFSDLSHPSPLLFTHKRLLKIIPKGPSPLFYDNISFFFLFFFSISLSKCVKIFILYGKSCNSHRLTPQLRGLLRPTEWLSFFEKNLSPNTPSFDFLSEYPATFKVEYLRPRSYYIDSDLPLL